MRYTPAMDQSYTFNNKQALVMGLGRFGGGLGVTRYLLRQGARVVLNDQASEEELSTSLADLGNQTGLSLALGHHSPRLLEDIDLLVVNPAVPRPWENAFIEAAVDKGIRVTTEIEIAYRQLNPDQIIAITGSAGKSTTCAMTHHALASNGLHSILGGNIGGSLLDRLGEISNDTTIVLELSSAMLYWLWGRELESPPSHPAVSCVTSFNANHLDWHGGLEHYHASKKHILCKKKRAVLPESLASWAYPNTRIVTKDHIIHGCEIPGSHNAMNAALAHACIQELHPQLEESEIVNAIRSFSGLPHRLNRCFEHNGVVYFDDSKSTTPQATLLAVDALQTLAPRNRVHLIVGGYDKGADLTSLAKLATELAGLYCIGTTAESIVSNAHRNAYLSQNLETAMQQIHSRAERGDLVVLSPGCASWDQFDNYEVRGTRFIQLAKNLAGVTA